MECSFKWSSRRLSRLLPLHPSRFSIWLVRGKTKSTFYSTAHEPSGIAFGQLPQSGVETLNPKFCNVIRDKAADTHTGSFEKFLEKLVVADSN